ncbi:hypothetical protein ACWOA0_05710 [Ignavigranum ruoffiae]|uniref:hypothetical protein n=1 Tax=Ignavigranum ruoffiae TaxID=89093 RepID=UPI002353091D|nr:hypothetical protein [Ignavigranum ruoffiae]
MQSLINFFLTLTFSDWISFIALLVSLYSVYYTHKENKHTILITNPFIDLNDEYNPPKISFTIFNDSKNSITIEDIQISKINGETIHHLSDYQPSAEDSISKSENSGIFGKLAQIETGFNLPPRFISPDEYQHPFENEITIASNSEYDFSYYLAEPITEAKITVTTNKKIHHFKRTKLFVVKFSKF